VGIFVTCVAIPVIWAFVYSGEKLNGLQLSPDVVRYFFSLAVGIGGGFACRRFAIQYIREADAAARAERKLNSSPLS
jgi:hypothetical protein